MTVHQPSETVSAYLAAEHRLFIDGAWQDAAVGGRIAVVDPATGQVVAQVAEATEADVDRAVAAARASFDDGRWWGKSADERSRILWRLSELIEANADELAQIEVIDNGMPIAFAQWELSATASWFRHFSGQTRTIYGVNGSGPMSGGGVDMHAYTVVEPVGVAALIVPWNAPVGNMAIKLAPALAAGCSVVVKPAEDTPLAALRIAELAIEAGLPAGVLNVVPGYGRTAGRALVDHPLVDKVSFTGSTETGKQIVQGAAGNLKRVTLELGGKSPVIVFDDADIEAAIPKVAMGIFANSGQVCFAGSRLYVQRGSYDRLLAGIADFARSLKVGSGFDPANLIGPLVSEKQKQRVAGYLEQGVAAGAEIVTGGGSPRGSGYFIEPTVFANVEASMSIVREEIFGPVLVATPFDDADDLIRIANDSRYGLGAGIYTQDVDKAHRIARRLQAGNVWVNCYGITHPAMPFGGFKESGWGREMGPDGLAAFTETKSVFVQLK